MRKPKINITVLKEDTGYSANANIEKNSIFTQGDSFDDLKLNILEAINLAFEDKGFVYKMDEIGLSFDLPSFFDFYKVLNVSALSKRLRMPQSLLSQYINGIKRPSVAQTQRILKGVQQVGRELAEINFIFL